MTVVALAAGVWSSLLYLCFAPCAQHLHLRTSTIHLSTTSTWDHVVCDSNVCVFGCLVSCMIKNLFENVLCVLCVCLCACVCVCLCVCLCVCACACACVCCVCE